MHFSKLVLEIPAGTPNALSNIIKECLEYDPQKRLEFEEVNQKLPNLQRELIDLKEEQWQKISQNDIDMNNVDVKAEIKASYYATKLEE